jgi:IclR family transcriptional regulator, acetate operon repressor
MRRKATLETPSIQSLGRGLTILEAVAESPEPVALRDLTGLLGIDRSSVFRLANTLRQRRFLTNPEGSNEFVLGPSVWRLSRRYGRYDMVSRCREQLRALSVKTGETAHLAVRDGRQALFVDHYVPTGQVLTVSGQTGELVPIHATAHGKALLTDFTATGLLELFGRTPLQRHTKRTVVTLDDLAKVTAKIADLGFAMDDGELIDGLRCVAAPIRDRDDHVVASIGISAPSTRFPKSRYRPAGELVARYAKAVAASLSA